MRSNLRGGLLSSCESTYGLWEYQLPKKTCLLAVVLAGLVAIEDEVLREMAL